MKQEPAYNLDEFIFYDRSNWFDRIIYALLNSAYKFSKMSSLIAPVQHRRFLKRYKSPTLVELGKAVGINDATLLGILRFNEKRDAQYRFVAAIASVFITFLPLAIMTIFIAKAFEGFISQLNLQAQVSSFILTLLSLIIIWAIMLYGMRIATFLIDRYFADTLCIASSIFLLIELSRETALTQPDRQRSILFRLRMLARNILLLAYYYESPSAVNNAWLQDFFTKMEMRIREYERWAIAPDENTISNLRKEINKLMLSLITRNYGDVSYELPAIPIVDPQTQHSSVAILINRIVGLAIPGFILGVMYFFPDQIGNIGVDRNIVGLISISWLLLTMDASLGLGITDRLSGLAKAIRELE